MTRAARFTQADVTRALRSVDKAGLRGAVVKLVPTGEIVILTAEHEAANDGANPLDRVLGR
jgi:hypothetical protein